MNNRISTLQKRMSRHGVSNLFITSLSDIYYFTGFTGSTANLFVTPDSAVFTTDGRYTEQAGRQIGSDAEIRIVQDYRKALTEIADKISSITVTYDCGLNEYEYLYEELKDVRIENTGLIDYMRAVKDEGELDKIREMFLCASDSFHASLEYFKPGIKELFWAAELEKNMKMNGARCPSFDTIVGSGYRGAMPHGIASDKIVEKGDAVVVDFGSKKEYCSDVTRLVKTGPDSEVDKIADIVYTALSKAKDAVRAGVKCSDIDAVARDYIASKGYEEYFNHGLGHGVGIDVHEKPVFNPRDHTVLEENMVLTIEPGIYLPERFGVRLEDTIVVKNDGCENLTAVFEKYIYDI
ncbi:peptidase M24 [Denitrovibrio acetiphilus DSM 12809]|uniref:Peptidase M24 n=1 Tax=Denitrovibrio acetiphilus (strain DSM 12809 / NBRC 114555 / N2460) TaxID=522772 RepID=D4H1C1_DENA2|nr:Xaa-Pro peptidase family protein [Denitrovibrio acetiphilus]ADD66869.1 peptidase M24 [Denitrovibrio acetiphilus DSM 12809]